MLAQSSSSSLRVRSATDQGSVPRGDEETAPSADKSRAARQPNAASANRGAAARDGKEAKGRRQEFDGPKSRQRDAADELDLPRARPVDQPLIRKRRDSDNSANPTGEVGSKNAVRRQATDDGAATPSADGDAAMPQRARAPFKLTAQEEARVDEILNRWEMESKKVKTFKCNFTKWDYDDTFAPAGAKKLHKSKIDGVIKFKSPDCGVYEEQEVLEVLSMAKKGGPAHVKPESNESANLQHWVCDGKSVFQLDHEAKKLIQREIPPDMQGRAIIDGPLPFVFGAEAQRLKSRYWIRESPYTRDDKEHVTLEIWPKYQADAANYEFVEFSLLAKNFKPYGVCVHLPGGKSRSSYQFSNMSVNNIAWKILDDFAAPKTPSGWTREIEKSEVAGPPANTAPAQRNQAKRPATPLK